MHALCYSQRLANSHRTEAQIVFWELIGTTLSGPGATGGIDSCASLSPKPQPTHSRDVDKQDLNAPLSKRCASVSLFMPWIPILDGLHFLNLPL